ncbi:MAG: sensor histidine kinase, partial [bacterium]
AYSPVPDETAASGIGGVVATVIEITEKVVAERRVVALRDLGARVGEAKTAENACTIAAETLALHAKDVPFALFYLVDGDGRHARLEGAAGLGASSDIGRRIVDLHDPGGGWPFAEAIRTEAPVTVTRLAEHFASVPAGPWADPPTTAVVLVIPSNRAHQPAGVMVAGVSARLRLDAYHGAFLELVRNQVATAIANARAYEEERRRAQTLAELDRAKTAFFSNVSHEFRTPLTLMMGPIEDSLADAANPLPPEQRARQELVRRNGLRLQKLVNTLLDFARIEAGRSQASFVATDLAALTADLASTFRSAVEHAGLAFVVDCAPLALPVHVDPSMWEKIVLNLISNAFKFTFEGEIAVRLTAAGERVELSVRDTGTGIAPDELPHVFERFHRVEGARGRSHEGTGIGLALVQELIRLHGGDVEVDSILGEGSTFRVTIPAFQSSGAADPLAERRRVLPASAGAEAFLSEIAQWTDGGAAASEGGPAEAAASGEQRARILVADDNADMRHYIVRLLSPDWD